SADGQTLVVGRVDGTIGVYKLASPAVAAERPLTQLSEVPPEVDYGQQPALDSLPKIAEVEPNDEPEQAASISAPGVATGRIFAAEQRDGRDEDLFRFEAKAGDQWIIETKAARAGSPLDTKLEILDSRGQPLPRLLLRAVRDSVIEFRGMNS